MHYDKLYCIATRRGLRCYWVSPMALACPVTKSHHQKPSRTPTGCLLIFVDGCDDGHIGTTTVISHKLDCLHSFGMFISLYLCIQKRSDTNFMDLFTARSNDEKISITTGPPVKHIRLCCNCTVGKKTVTMFWKFDLWSQ